MFPNSIDVEHSLHYDALFWIVGLFLSAILVGLFRRRAVIDIPESRSMHSVPTPRGGGVGIVIAFYSCLLLWSGFAPQNHFFTLPLLLGGIPIAIVGFVDDHRHLPAPLRAMVHLLACLIAFAALTRFWARPMEMWNLELFAWLFGATVAGAYFVNIFNFMDGLDGLAASEATIVGTAATVLLAASLYGVGIRGTFDEIPFAAMLLAMCSLGFLVWNWPPAKIFMGDVGSGFVGFVLAFLALSTTERSLQGLWLWMILLGVFIVDGSYTLIVRFLTGQRWHEAHSLHAFQKAAKRSSHLAVTLSVVAINVFWLVPLAAFEFHNSRNGLWITLLAYTPLVVVAARFRAGIQEPPPAIDSSVAQ